MCGRTALAVLADVLIERFDAEPTEPIEPRYNIAPGDDLAVIRNESPDIIDQLRWGLVPHWADDPAIGNRLINARSETLAEKPSFRDAYAERRCLVLVDGFYEWTERNGQKQPYRICKPDNAPFALAGLWENGRDVATTTIVTTDANDVVEPIHDRMPVILPEEVETAWLESGDEELLAPYHGDDLECYPISTLVNDPTNDSPEIIEPVEVTRAQRGLDEFA